MSINSVWGFCIATSVTVNVFVVAAVGMALKHQESHSIVAKKEPHSRLVEIQEQKPKPKKAKNGKPGKNDIPTGKINLSKNSSGLKPVVFNRKSHAHGVLHANYGVPHPTVTPRFDGVIDLRDAKLKVVLHADPKDVPKSMLGKNNKSLGKSVVEYIGGKPKITAKCVASIGGNTSHGGHLKIIGGKNVEISGTKFCRAGGVPMSFGAGGQGGGSSTDGEAVSMKGAFIPDPHQAVLEKNYAQLVTRPANYSAEGVNPGRQSGPIPGIAGEIRPPHLPENDSTYNSAMSEEQTKAAKTVEREKQEREDDQKALITKIGSLSKAGQIPWRERNEREPHHGLMANFYLGRNQEKYLFTRKTPNINFRWTGMKVDPELPLGVPYSVRWSGYIRPDYTEDYNIFTCSDDGVRLYIDNKLVIDNWTNHADTEDVVQLPLEAGRAYAIRVDYYEASGLSGQVIKLYWESPSQPKEYVPERCLFYEP